MKPFLSICSVLLLVFCVFAETAEHRPAGEHYLDPEIKVTFPAEIRNFRKQEVIRSFNPMVGTTIRYSDSDGNCADVYIYLHPKAELEISEAQLELHFQELKKAVLSLPEKGMSVKKSEMIRESGIRIAQPSGKQNLVNGHQAVFWITTEGNVAQLSHLILFPFRGKIIKLRMSCDETKASEFTAGIISAFFGTP